MLPDGWADALRAAADLPLTPNSIERLARTVPLETARWAIQQTELRRRAAPKFPRAAEMLFDRDGLEMATHPLVADLHHALLPADLPRLDLTCGIGADLIALSQTPGSIGYELDPLRATYAHHNLAVYGRTAEIRVADCRSAPNSGYAAFLDPMRRKDGKRTPRPADSLPNPYEISPRHIHLLIKLSPMTPDQDLEQFNSQILFVSLDHSCPEALVLRRDSEAPTPPIAIRAEDHLSLQSDPTLILNTTPEPGSVLLEADPAAIRAHALSALCHTHNLLALGQSNGYLTGDTSPESPWLTPYHVVWSGSYRPENIKKQLASLHATLRAVKTRGVKLNPEAVRKSLNPKPAPDQQPLLLILYPDGPRIAAALVARP